MIDAQQCLMKQEFASLKKYAHLKLVLSHHHQDNLLFFFSPQEELGGANIFYKLAH